ncbi:PSII 6.1 kDa protein [Trebouxia sp. C0009 RCD-2024]
MAFAAPSSELKHVAPEVLLDYLRGAVSRLASSPTLAQRLGQPTADVERAMKSTFEDLCAAKSRNGSSSHKLVFRHDCQNLTCLNPRCPLCCQNPNKRCPDSVHFASKYLEKNPLRSRCGANIRIEVVDTATGELAHHTSLQGVVLELSMVDGKKYGSLLESGEDIASCELFLTPKGKALLNPGRTGFHTTENRVRMPLTARGHAVLGTDFTVQVSSEAMLGGQKAPYKLLVRAVDQRTGLEVPSITFVASEDFVVATPRVAKAVKAEIPCVDDLVGKLEDIGEKTKDKLANLAAAAETCGASDLAFPFPSVTTVGHFRQLVELSNTDPRFNDKLKQYLIPNKAREHVALAVENDKRLRMWFPEPNTEGGLMYRSVRARVDLDHPDMLVQNTRRPDGSLGPELTPCGQTQGDQKAHTQRLIGKAKEDWGTLDHPNWSIRDVDSSDFLDSHLQPGQAAYEPILKSRHLDHGLGLGSGSSNHQGSGSLGGAVHLSGLGLSQGSAHQGSGNLVLDHSQGSEQFSGQLLGPNPSRSGASGWPGSGAQGQYGNPHLGPGGGLSPPDSSFAVQHEQLYQNTGSSQYTSSNGHPPTSSSGFGGFPRPSSSPFLDFNAQHTSMADIFPAAAQPATSQPGSATIGHWGSGSGAGSGSLPHQFPDPTRGPQQDVHNNSSSQGSRSNRPFGSTFSPSARRPAGHSPALSQSSVPSHATNGHHFYPTLGQSPSDSAAARPSGLDRIDSGCTEPGPKRMRSPLQQQSGDNSPGYRHEIAMQQQLLKQQHGGSNSAMGSGGLFGGLGQHSTDGSQVQMHSQTAGSGSMQGGQQQAAPQQPHTQLGHSDLEKNLSDHHDLPSEENFLETETPFLLSENSMQFMAPTEPQAHESNHGRPPPNPTNSSSQLHNYLAIDSRHAPMSEPLRNHHVRFSPMPAEPEWKVPHTSTNSRSTSPIHLDLEPRSSSEDLIANANPNLNGIDPARAKWSQKDRWSSGNIFSSFSSSQRKQLGASGKSDGLDSMRDMQESLADLEDMDADPPDVLEGL